MKACQIFDSGSEQYAEARPRYPVKFFEYLSQISPDLTCAWDCATGNGQAAKSLSQHFNQVLATDISLNQVQNAFEASNIYYSVQPAEQTGFSNNQFSLVTVAQALHWFDLDGFWPEVQRVLQPGGIFAAWSYTWPRVDDKVDPVVKTMLLDIIEPYWASENQAAWDGYRSCSFPFSERRLPDHSMSVQWTASQFLSYLATWSATRLCMDKNGMDFFYDFGTALKRAWKNIKEPRLIFMEFYYRVGKHNP